MAAKSIVSSNPPGKGQLMELIKNLRQNIIAPKTENGFGQEHQLNNSFRIPTCNAINGSTLDCSNIKAEPLVDIGIDQPVVKKIKLEDSNKDIEQNSQEHSVESYQKSYQITKNGLNQWILHYQDYQYSMQRRGSNLWQCIHVSQCPATCAIQGSDINILTQHNHEPEPKGYNQEKYARSKLTSTTIDDESVIKNILADLKLNKSNIETETRVQPQKHEPPTEICAEYIVKTSYTNGDSQPQQDPSLLVPDTFEPLGHVATTYDPSLELAIKNDRSLMQLWNTLVQDNYLVTSSQNSQDLNITNGTDENELYPDAQIDANLTTDDYFNQLMTNFTSSIPQSISSFPFSKIENSIQKLYIDQRCNATAIGESQDLIHTTDSNFKYFLTLKGNKLLIHDNFIYRIRQEGSKRWRCTEKSCPGKAMLAGESICVTQGHNHSPDLEKVVKKGCLSDLVCAAFKCENINEINQLYADFTLNLPANSVNFLPTLASLGQLYKQIKKFNEGGILNSDLDKSQYGNVADMATLIKNYRSMTSKEISYTQNSNENHPVGIDNTIDEKFMLNNGQTSTFTNKNTVLRKIAIKRDADLIETKNTAKESMTRESSNYEIDDSFKTYLMYGSQNISPAATPLQPLTIRIKRAPTLIAPAQSLGNSIDQTMLQNYSPKTNSQTMQRDITLTSSASPLPNVEDYHPVKCKFIKNLQGHSQVVHCDFNYRLRGEGVNRWRCVEAGCRGKCSVYDGNSIIVTCEHDHLPYPEKVKKKEILGEILFRACECRESTADDIIQQVMRDLDPETLLCLPNALAMKQMIERARNTDFGSNDLYKRINCKTPAWRTGAKGLPSYKTPNSLSRQRPQSSQTPDTNVEINECDPSDLPYTFIMSINGSKQIVYQGYNYRMRVPSKNRWRCVEAGCLGACFAEGSLIQITQEHNHTPKEEKIARKKVLGDLVYRAVVTQPHEPAEALIDEVMAELDDHVRAQLPSYTSLKQLVARSRSTSSTPNDNIPHKQDALHENDPLNLDNILKGGNHSLKTTVVQCEGVNETLQYFISRKGQCHIIFKGYVYRWPRLNKNVWRCKSKSCGGKCAMHENRIKIVAGHNHPPIIDQGNLSLIEEGDVDINTTSSFPSLSKTQTSVDHTAGSPSFQSSYVTSNQHFVIQDDHQINVSSRAIDAATNGKMEINAEAPSYEYLYLIGYVLALEYDFTTRSHYNLQSHKPDNLIEARLERLKLYNKSLHVPHYQCFRCEFTTESNVILDDHQRKPHRKTCGSSNQSILECPYCKFVSQWAPLMCEHLKVQHKLTPSTMPSIEPITREYMCPRCPYEVDIEKNWAQHIEKCLSRKSKSLDILSPNENFTSYFPLLQHLKSPMDNTVGNSLSAIVSKDDEATHKESNNTLCQIKPFISRNQSDTIEFLDKNAKDTSTAQLLVANKVDKYNISLDGVQLVARVTDHQRSQHIMENSLNDSCSNKSQESQKESPTPANAQNALAINSKGLASAHFILTTNRDRLKEGLKRIMNKHEKGQSLEHIESLNNLDYYLDYLIPQTIYEILKDAIRDD